MKKCNGTIQIVSKEAPVCFITLPEYEDLLWRMRWYSTVACKQCNQLRIVSCLTCNNHSAVELAETLRGSSAEYSCRYRYALNDSTDESWSRAGKY